MAERKTLQDLTIKDNFMFGAVMMDEEICRELLELVLGFRIAKVMVASVYKGQYAPNRVISVIYCVILNRRTSSTPQSSAL